MDSWSDKQVAMMRLGGNEKLAKWFKEKGVSSGLSIAEKYNSDAAELYRLRLAAARDGKELPTVLPPKRQPATPPPSAAAPPQSIHYAPPAPPQQPAADPLDDFAKQASQTFSSLSGTLSMWGASAAEKIKEANLGEVLKSTGDRIAATTATIGEGLATTSEKLVTTVKDPNLSTKISGAASGFWESVKAVAAVEPPQPSSSMSAAAPPPPPPAGKRAPAGYQQAPASAEEASADEHELDDMHAGAENAKSTAAAPSQPPPPDDDAWVRSLVLGVN